MSNKVLTDKFLDEPGAHVALAPDLTIVEAGPVYQKITGETKPSIIGKNIFEVFPANPRLKPANRLTLENSFKRVLETGETDKLDPFRYDIQQSDGAWQQKWWKMTNIPVKEDGVVTYIVQRAEDVSVEYMTANGLKGIRRSNYILYLCTIIALAISISSATDRINSTHSIATKANTAAQQAKTASKKAAIASKKASVATEATDTLIQAGRKARFQELSDLCTQVNRIDGRIRDIILNSTKNTKPFEHIYRQLGLPPYAQRLKLAEQQASGFSKPVQCKAIKTIAHH